MRFDPKDTVGIVLVAGTFSALALHGNDTHQEKHLPPIADAGAAATSARAPSAVAFVDFHVLPMNGEDLQRRQVVVVRDGFITHVGPLGVIDIPEDARVVEGAGNDFLVPGLVDAHVHLPDAREDILPLFLANGVTTVFNLEGDERHLALRGRSRASDFAGPTIYTSGPFVHDAAVRTWGGIDRLVEEHVSQGYDFLKIHGTLSEQEYAALSDAAREHEVAVVGHAPRNLPFEAVIRNRQAGVVHAEELIYTALQSLDVASADEVGRAMVQADTWLTPAISTFQNITEQWASPDGLTARLEQPEVRYLPSDLRWEWENGGVYTQRPAREQARIEQMNDFHSPLVAALDAAGVRMLTGTDTPLPGLVPGFSLHDEIDAFLAAGLAPETVLEAATANAGRFVRDHVDANARFGTIEVGARADLLTVDSDPRQTPRVLRRPLGVMSRGTWYGRADLEQMLAHAAGEVVADLSH